MDFVVAPEYFKKKNRLNPEFGGRMGTVLLADDHVFVLNSLRTLLDAADAIQIVAMAADGAEAMGADQIFQAQLRCEPIFRNRI